MIAPAAAYQIPPSKYLNISDEYTAFCLDEACYYISMKEASIDKEDGGSSEHSAPVISSKTYSSPSELYADLNVSNIPKGR